MNGSGGAVGRTVDFIEAEPDETAPRLWRVRTTAAGQVVLFHRADASQTWDRRGSTSL